MISAKASSSRSFLGLEDFNFSFFESKLYFFHALLYSFALVKASTNTCSTPILVSGNLVLCGDLDLLTFSPSANFMYSSASFIIISFGLDPHFNLIIADCPPIGLADP